MRLCLRHSAIEWPEIPLCPREGVRFVDSHLHLDGEDARITLNFALSADALLLACGVDERTSLELLTLAESSPKSARAFVGVHPSEAEKAGEGDWLAAAAPRASGIGEVGLDPNYSSIGEGSAQLTWFTRQLEVAEESAKPVQVHTRGAEAKCLEVLARYRVPHVLLHWLESESELPEATRRGYFVSLGPALLYSKRLQRIAARADPSLLLLESDSPVSYSPLGGVRGPMLIPSVAFRLAEIRGEPFDRTLALCAQNSLRFLGEKG